VFDVGDSVQICIVSSIEALDRCLPILSAKRYDGQGIRSVLSTEWRSHYRLQIFPPGERIPAVIRHSVKADSVDAVNHGAPDIKAITETSLMWFSWRAVVSPLVSATACIDFCSVPPEWKMASCDRSIYRPAEFLLQDHCYNSTVIEQKSLCDLKIKLIKSITIDPHNTIRCKNGKYLCHFFKIFGYFYFSNTLDNI